jgi:hypothetical protein
MFEGGHEWSAEVREALGRVLAGMPATQVD